MGGRTASDRGAAGLLGVRSTVSGSKPLDSTVQLLGELHFFACSCTNSAKSSSLRGLVLPRFRPGSSW